MRLHEAERFDPAVPDEYNRLSIHYDTTFFDREKLSVEPQHKRLEPHYKGHIGLVPGRPDYYDNPYYRYSSSESKHLNQMLAAMHKSPPGHDIVIRKTYSEVTGKLHDTLQNKIKLAPATPEHIVAFSGLGNSRVENMMNAVKKGGSVAFPAYTSTSILFQKATGFARSQHEPGPDGAPHITTHIAVFHIPKNSRGVVYLGNSSAHPHERELLINAGTRTVYSHTTEHRVTNKSGSSQGVHCHHFLYEQPEWADHPHDGHPFPNF